MQTIENTVALLKRINTELFGTEFSIDLYADKKGGDRNYLQVGYTSPCSKTGVKQEWVGRKWYLSEFMLDDEVVKTAFAAFKAAIEHEVLEAFKVDGVPLFNPHTNFEALLQVSVNEVKRVNNTQSDKEEVQSIKEAREEEAPQSGLIREQCG